MEDKPIREPENRISQDEFEFLISSLDIDEVAAESAPLPLEPCACGGIATLSTDHDGKAACDMFRYVCRSCMAQGPLALDENSARSLWNIQARAEAREWPACARCGEPTAPDGTPLPDGRVFCAICAQDLGIA